MRVQMARLEAREVVRQEAGGARRPARWMCATLFAAAVLLALPAAARSQQTVPCPPEQQPLLTIPELASQNGVLTGTVMLSDELEAIPSRQPPQMLPGDPNAKTVCQQQRVRILRGVGATPAAPQPSPAGALPNPMPGPTLRARVGDIINLTFINQVNPGNFPGSIDNGEKGLGCDKPTPPGDRFPDCFHGSSTGNIHFHGSHVNPNNTGDNVFIEVRPLPRNNQGNLTTTPQEAQQDLDKFYAQCRQQLAPSPLVPWPKSWNDMPSDWTNQQKSLIQAYDKKLLADYGPNAKALWPINAQQIAVGAFPQYYIGVFPYCFRIPEWKGTSTQTSAATPAGHTGHMASPQEPRGGAGTAELNSRGVTLPEQHNVSPDLRMGQSPGTHWYHAHKHGSTAINVANGMTGAFIIEGPYDDALNNFYGTDWTRAAKVMIINQLGVTPNLLRGGTNNQQGGITATDKGPDFSVNGQMNPVINMRPGEVQMWRIVNTSGRAGAFFNTPSAANLQWMQIAQDGVQFDWDNANTRRNKSFLLASGNRADLLVQARSCPQNQTSCSFTFPVIVQNEVDPSDLSRALPIKLFTVNVSGEQVPSTSPAGQLIPQASFPQRPAFLDDIKDSEVTGTKIITFGSKGLNLPAAPGSAQPPMAMQHTIDNKKFDGEVGALVQLNKVEEWKIVNQTFGPPIGPPIAHPFHIHVNPFQVTEIFDPNANVTVTYLDPKTKKPVIDPKTKKPITATVPQYVIAAGALYTNARYPTFQAQVRSKQCVLNPQAPESWQPCQPQPPNVNNIWWDVFPIPSGNAMSYTDPKTKQTVSANVPGYFKMRSRFVDYAGYYVLHCHILAHEDRGMMTVVEVSPATTPYSHH
jgi:FtsP/CotA-like multicopper oxidase with cupredoxin domain